MLKSLEFKSFEFNSRKETLIGIDATRKYVIKIQIIKNKNKANSIEQEYEVMKHLNKNGCVTCPEAYELGTVQKSEIYPKTRENNILDSIDKTKFEYIIQEYIPDSGTHKLADIVLALIEQKKLGVYQGDVKPDNVRFDPSKNICYFIDYDQSIFLSDEQSNLDNISFLNFCSEYDKAKYGFGNWLRHFSRYTERNVTSLFSNKAFNLEATTVFKTQKTTNSASGIYHSIDERDIFINGSRALDVRAKLLDECTFDANERVLDIGCNAGLLSMYLHDRGCRTVGVDNDPHIVVASKIISNILGKNIEYFHLDLDRTEQVEDFDTIMLFSVIHHTRDLVKNARKIANSCSRFFLETRLIESGKQPYGDIWVDTTRWSFDTVDELVSFCESIFEGFKLKTNLGMADKDRYILEFVK
jgi:2-polyprenyl-3-methyl-5-hydroxy-6-metoxy-1,4-benzoquinol methylase